MSARTARRRRKQALLGHNHLAKLGRGNNNRPIFHKKSVTKLQRKEQLTREKMKTIALRKSMRNK